jgi:hypothetical protein
MKANVTSRRLVLVALVILFAILACTYQGYNISIQQMTPGETVEPTDSVVPVDTLSPVETVVPVDVTPVEPTLSKEIEALIPVTGSLLRWADFSDFVFIPPGEFTMGEDRPEGGDTLPMHTVDLGGYWIHQAEVTNKQYALCVDADICKPPKIEADIPYRYGNNFYLDYPVVGVDWFQAQLYCDWIKGRLPTEAEWEKAGRGTEGFLYPWGQVEPNCTLLNFDQCFNPPEPNYVRSYMESISPYDAFDLSGNVFEWTNDWYAEDYYAQSPKSDPTGPDQGEFKVVRGGSFLTSPNHITLVERTSIKPDEHSLDLGFRCVLAGNVLPPPPICQVAPLAPALDQVNVTPIQQGSGAKAVGFCTGQVSSTSPGGAFTSIDVSFGSDVSAGDYTVTANGSPLNCKPYLSDATRVACYGSGLAQNSMVDIEVCRGAPTSVAVPSGEPVCPSGYTYNSSSTLCEYGKPGLPAGPCPKGYTDVAGVGCAPVPVAGTCPEGFYSVNLAAAALCAPLDPCLYPNPPKSCDQPQSCLPGYTYKADQGCCAPPAQPQPVCPIGYDYNDTRGICIKRVNTGNQCATFSVHIPACPTAVPQQGGNCSQYTNPNTCGQAGCKWDQPVTGGPGSCK